MFLEQTGTVVNEDWTWAEAWADLGLRPTLDDLGLRLEPILDQPWADFWLTLGRLLENFRGAGGQAGAQAGGRVVGGWWLLVGGWVGD